MRHLRCLGLLLWTSLSFAQTQIDASFSLDGTTAYFFKDNRVVKFDNPENRVLEVKSISETFPGVNFTKIDAAMVGGNNKLYFFSGRSYTRVDMLSFRADAGYPKDLENWSGLEAALAGRQPNPNPNPQPNPNPTYGKFKVSKIDIDLAPYTIESPNKVVADFQIEKGIGGQTIIGFQQKHTAIIMKVDANGTKVGKATELKGYWLSDIHPMEDGSIVVLVGKDVNNTYIEEYPNTLYFINISASGVAGSPKHIFGGEGHGPGKSWFDGRTEARIAYNGSNFGLYFEVQKNYAETGEDIHNGDMFIETDKQGNKLENTKHFWTASHSNTVQVTAAKNKEFWTITSGDANPFGWQVYNRNQDKEFVIWPPKEDFVPYSECESSTPTGMLYFMQEEGDNFFAIAGTLDHPNIGWKTKVDPMFLKFDKSGKVLEKKFLKVSPSVDESAISVYPLGANYLMAWGEGNVYEDNYQAANFEICIIDGNGNFKLQPTAVAYPFSSASNIVPVSDKVFVWLNADNESKAIEFYKLVFE